MNKDDARTAYVMVLKNHGVSISNDYDFSAEDLAETISPSRMRIPKGVVHPQKLQRKDSLLDGFTMPTTILDHQNETTTASSDVSFIEEQCELELMALEMNDAAFSDKSFIDRKALLARIIKN